MVGKSDKLKCGNQKGLTLIEVMIGLVVIGISVLAMYIMFINGREMIMEQHHRRLALEKARELMEDMQYNKKKQGIVPESYRGTDEEILVPGNGREEIVAERTVTVEYSPQVNLRTGQPYYCEVSVVYEWEELSGREYSIELRSAF
jgi:prepilin-type N-terminal cleavage/methylation domain-containing protein